MSEDETKTPEPESAPEASSPEVPTAPEAAEPEEFEPPKAKMRAAEVVAFVCLECKRRMEAGAGMRGGYTTLRIHGQPVNIWHCEDIRAMNITALKPQPKPTIIVPFTPGMLQQ